MKKRAEELAVLVEQGDLEAKQRLAEARNLRSGCFVLSVMSA